MPVFLAITLSTAWLALGLWGMGRAVGRTAAPAAAMIRGWAIFLLVCALPWFFAFAARWVAPCLWVLTAAGVVVAVRSLGLRVLAGAAAGCAAAATLFALPFLLHPHLLAYAHWGTDQWGYASVARWLLRHSVRDLPVIDNRPGLDWVWFVLKTHDRPLAYLALAAISGMFGYATLTAYFVFPAVLTASVFLSFFLEKPPLGVGRTPARCLFSLGVAAQPLILAHFQHQFLGGAALGLVLMLLATGLVQVQARDEGDPGFFAFALLLMVLSIGLYTLTVSLVGVGLVAAVFAWSSAKAFLRRRQSNGFSSPVVPRSRGIVIGLVVAAALASYAEIRTLVPDRLGGPIAKGLAGHPWIQMGSLYGETAITPWYAGDDAPGWLNPLRYNPPGGTVRTALFAALIAVLAVQAVLWARRRRDIAVGLVLAVSAAVLWRLMPPRGSHWLVSRSLPLFGPMLVATAAAAAASEPRRWLKGTAAVLACLPLALAAPGLKAMLTRPVNRFFIADCGRPPQDEPWHALAYAYFVEGKRPIDWSAAPKSFEAMTHYMPEDLRPTLKKPRK